MARVCEQQKPKPLSGVDIGFEKLDAEHYSVNEIPPPVDDTSL
jgi:hypothetical protein